MMSLQQQQRTFYRRSLPDGCVALSSKAGRKLFDSASTHKGLKAFFSLLEHHTTQAEPAFCGISTLTMCLNALAVDPRQIWKGPWRWYEESMLNCCVDLDIVKKTGITLHTFDCLAKCQGLDTTLHYAEEATLEGFRQAVRQVCIEQEDDNDDDGILKDVLVVSYNRAVVGQTGVGHFSPIGAYDEASDSVLILDTARFKYPVHWVPLPLLFEAMKPIDEDSGRSRGYVLLRHCEDDSLPISLLFRSKMNQSHARRLFKDFWKQNERQLTFESVLQYFSSSSETNRRVWDMFDPAVKPVEEETIALVEDLRKLIACLMKESAPDKPCCSPNVRRTINLDKREAAFVIYLASMDEAKRQETVAAAEAGSETVRQQLLSEAELVRYAIDMCEEFEFENK